MTGNMAKRIHNVNTGREWGSERDGVMALPCGPRFRLRRNHAKARFRHSASIANAKIGGWWPFR